MKMSREDERKGTKTFKKLRNCINREYHDSAPNEQVEDCVIKATTAVSTYSTTSPLSLSRSHQWLLGVFVAWRWQCRGSSATWRCTSGGQGRCSSTPSIWRWPRSVTKTRTKVKRG